MIVFNSKDYLIIFEFFQFFIFLDFYDEDDEFVWI